MRTLAVAFGCMMLMAGCASTYTVGSKESGADYDCDEFNRRLEKREGTVVFNSRKVEIAKQINASKDSVSWLDVRTDKKTGASMRQLSRIVIKDHLLGGLEGLGFGLVGGGGLGMIVGSVLIKEGNTGSGSGAAIGLILGGITGLVVGFPTGLITGHSDEYEYPPPEQSDSSRNTNPAQNNEQGSPELPSRSKPESTIRFHPMKTSAEVVLQDGVTTSGYLSEVDEQGVSILTTAGDVHILHPEIQKITIPGKHATGKRVAYGAFVGAYLNVYMQDLYKSDPFYLNQRTGESVGRLISSILTGMLFGAGVGYLFDAVSSQDEVIDFNGGKALHTKGLNRLRSLAKESLEESSVFSKIHFTVQGGQVFTNVQDYGSRGYGIPNRDASNFNWMRRWEIAYSATSEIDVGVSKIWFGEPSLQDSRYNASGYYLTGHYTPHLWATLDSVINLSLGLGVGNADVSYQRHGYSFHPDGFYYFTSRYVGISETLLTGVIMAEARFRIADGLTLGITVDHIIAPVRDVPGDPSVGIEPRTLHLGNTSLGFSLGLRL